MNIQPIARLKIFKSKRFDKCMEYVYGNMKIHEIVEKETSRKRDEFKFETHDSWKNKKEYVKQIQRSFE